jgi:hypothetical protein
MPDAHKTYLTKLATESFNTLTADQLFLVKKHGLVSATTQYTPPQPQFQVNIEMPSSQVLKLLDFITSQSEIDLNYLYTDPNLTNSYVANASTTLISSGSGRIVYSIGTRYIDPFDAEIYNTMYKKVLFNVSTAVNYPILSDMFSGKFFNNGTWHFTVNYSPFPIPGDPWKVIVCIDDDDNVEWAWHPVATVMTPNITELYAMGVGR